MASEWIRALAESAAALAPVEATTGRRQLRLSDLKIRTKEKSLQFFEPNTVQELYLKTLFPHWTPKKSPIGMKGLRHLHLKGRQFGMSTLILGLLFIDTVSTPYTHSVVIAHDLESTKKLFGIIQRFYESLPEELRPSSKYANRREYVWPDIDSSFFVGTAGAGNYGRGGTINNVHMSEVAFWERGNDIVAGLLQSVPENGNIFAETTANGYGNWFEEEWHLTKEKDGSNWTPFFWGWPLHAEYRASQSAVNGGFGERTPEEEILAESYGLDDAQLMWRRRKKRELKNLFTQEFPLNDDEAFLTTGTPFFDAEQITILRDRLAAPAHDPIAVDLPAIPLYQQLRENQEFLSVWKAPEPFMHYVIGADTAEGLNESGDHDYCVADVLCAETWEQVAQLRGRWEPRDFGRLLAQLGFWYEIALIVPERNNTGYGVLVALQEVAGYPLMGQEGPGGIYLHEDYDSKKDLKHRRAGWPTTPKSRLQMLSTLYDTMESEDILLHSRMTISEMRTFNKLPNHKIGAIRGKHDDCVMSLALALMGLTSRPLPRPSHAISGTTGEKSPYGVIPASGACIAAGTARDFTPELYQPPHIR
jgi:hypothetical protein